MDNNQNWSGSPFNPRPGVQNAPWGRPAQPGDEVVLDYAGFCDGEQFEGGTAEGQTLTLGRDRRDYRAFDKETVQIGLGGFDSAPRQRPAQADGAVAKTSFNDLRSTFTEDQMKAECARCLGCGTAVVNQYMCVGCGICTTKCKFDAIHLEKIYDADNQEYFHTLGRIVKNVPKIGINVVRKQFGKYGGGNA